MQGFLERPVEFIRRLDRDERLGVLRNRLRVRRRRPIRDALERRAVPQRLAVELLRIHHQERKERLGLLVGDLVEERKRFVVADADLGKHGDGDRARLEAAARVVQKRREPVRLAGRAAGLGPPVFVERVERRLRRRAVGAQLQQHVVELVDERLLAHAESERDPEAVAPLVGDRAERIVGRVAVREPQDLGAQHLGGRHEEPAVGVVAEVDVAGDHALDVEDAAVGVEVAAAHELLVRRAARLLVAREGLVAVARVDLGVGADRPVARHVVDRFLVLVEDAADLLARKGLHAALRQGHGQRGVGREADAAADVVQGVRADAVLGQGANEGLLDGQHLVVRDRLDVLVPGTDVVVDDVERVFALELDLAGVELAGGDLLELLDRDVDVREVDGLCHFVGSLF